MKAHGDTEVLSTLCDQEEATLTEPGSETLATNIRVPQQHREHRPQQEDFKAIQQGEEIQTKSQQSSFVRHWVWQSVGLREVRGKDKQTETTSQATVATKTVNKKGCTGGQ